MRVFAGSVVAFAGAMLVPIGLGTWGTAHAGTTSSRIARLESFATVGLAISGQSNFASTLDKWVGVQLGAGYRVGRSISLGALSGLDFLPTQGITYFPPNSDFMSANMTAYMVPICGYVAARMPPYRGARWYVSAHGGVYVYRTYADRADAPEIDDITPALGASLGFSGDEQGFAPRFEFGYEARVAPSGGLFGDSWIHVLTFTLGLRVQR